ncbi:hypothetical protein [Gorillibacterium massiliense]|nr:hypothetical protein [Gorillibacterium massiliense]
MKDILIKILIIGITLAAFTFFVANGLWNDTKTIDVRKDTTVTSAVIPTS